MKIETGDYAKVAGAAALTGVGLTTLKAAIRRGEITAAMLADGMPVYSIRDVERWAADTTRRRGPKSRAAR